jgi:hypothetical protein
LWEHILPHGRSQFRKDLAQAMLRSDQRANRANSDLKALYDEDSFSRRKLAEANRARLLDDFENRISRYMAENFEFSLLATDDPEEALSLEKACIATVARCPECQEAAFKAASTAVDEARPCPEEGCLWNLQHTKKGAPLTAEQWTLLQRRKAAF